MNAQPNRALEAAVARAEAIADLNAFVTIDPQPHRTAGPLAGRPIVVKDNIAVDGCPMTGGTPQLADHRPAADAAVVARLRAAGASIVGTTTLHELACGVTGNNGWTGAAANPVDPTRVAGGSSSGTAVAVAAGVVSSGLGTDTGGSCRIPAAFCGIVGFRPTTGRYPSGGLLTIVPTRDTPGLLATSVAEAAELDAIITAEAPVRAVPLQERRLGLVRTYLDASDASVRTVIERAVATLADAGAEIVEVDAGDVIEMEATCGTQIAVYELGVTLERFLASIGQPGLRDFIAGVASPDVAGLLTLAATDAPPDDVYRQAVAVTRPMLQARVAELFARMRVDALIGPTVIMGAPPIGDDDTTPLNGSPVPVFPTITYATNLASVAALPSLTVAAGRTERGLPVGLMLDGATGTDRALLSLGESVETALMSGPVDGR
jgi:indoleacetamide hydrolase